MTQTFDIIHTTTYWYARPVPLGAHRVLFRPHDSHDQRVLATDMEVDPEPLEIRMVQDAHSNSVAIVQPASPADRLVITSRFTVEHTGARALDLPLEPGCEFYPVRYTDEDEIVLQPYLLPVYNDPQGTLAAWAQQFVPTEGDVGVRDLLVQMNTMIRNTMRYQVRHEEGVQTPYETLALGSGSCRDFATLMIEAARSLGYAARFVSGYLYTPEGDNLTINTAPSSTHAWLQVYLPGAGWISFDPTNNLIGGSDLIRVAVVRHASEAMPVSGTWQGVPSDYFGMDVDVQVTLR